MKATFFILILILFSSFCFADENWRNELTVYSGISFLKAETEFNQCPICLRPFDFTTTQSLKSSLLIGFKYGHYFNENMEVEGNFSIAPTRDLRTESGFFCPPGVVCPLAIAFPPFVFDEQNAVTYYYDGNFVYNFHAGRITPFISAGLGGISTDIKPTTQHDLALTFGGGAKFTFENVGFRIEVNDRVIPDYFLTNNTENDLQVQYGVMFGF